MGVVFEKLTQPREVDDNHWLLASAANARITSRTAVAEINGR
jgi:hypothetical protein